MRERMTATYVRERTLQEEIAPAVEKRVPGIEVLAVELLSPSRFCVYVDHPKGVDHALCERVTRVLDAYRTDYTIDVSSPGPERPLRTPAHFASAVGRRVSVRTEVEIAGRNRIRGVVSDATEETVTVETGDAATLRIPYDVIVRGNLIDEGLTT
jgi:ribosome maturation factor RimP